MNLLRPPLDAAGSTAAGRAAAPQRLPAPLQQRPCSPRKGSSRAPSSGPSRRPRGGAAADSRTHRAGRRRCFRTRVAPWRGSRAGPSGSSLQRLQHSWAPEARGALRLVGSAAGRARAPHPPRSSLTAHQQPKGRRTEATTSESRKGTAPSPSSGPVERKEAAEPGQEGTTEVPEDHHGSIAADAEAATSSRAPEEPPADLSCTVVVEPINFEELEVEALKAGIAALRDEGGDLQSRNAELKAEVATLQDQGGDLQSRNSELKVSPPPPPQVHPGPCASSCLSAAERGRERERERASSCLSVAAPISDNHSYGFLQELVQDLRALAEQQHSENLQLKEELHATKQQPPSTTGTAEAGSQCTPDQDEEAAASRAAMMQELKSLRLQLEEAAEAGARGQTELSVARCEAPNNGQLPSSLHPGFILQPMSTGRLRYPLHCPSYSMLRWTS